jgi:hypothetical protein
MNYLNLINIILIILIIVCIGYQFYTKEKFYYRRRGMLIEQGCTKYDCSTESGKQDAINYCMYELKKLPNYEKMFKRFCESSDPIMKEMGCPDDCSVENLPPYLIEKSKAKQSLECKSPLQLGIHQITGDQYCIRNDGLWGFYKSKATLDAEAAEALALQGVSNLFGDKDRQTGAEYYRYFN